MINTIVEHSQVGLLLNDNHEARGYVPPTKKAAYRPATARPPFVPATQDRSFQPATRKTAPHPAAPLWAKTTVRGTAVFLTALGPLRQEGDMLLVGTLVDLRL